MKSELKVGDVTRTIEIADLPPNTSNELERLHEIVRGPNHSMEERKWARDKIDHIHKLFFMGAIYIQDHEVKP